MDIYFSVCRGVVRPCGERSALITPNGRLLGVKSPCLCISNGLVDGFFGVVVRSLHGVSAAARGRTMRRALPIDAEERTRARDPNLIPCMSISAASIP